MSSAQVTARVNEAKQLARQAKPQSVAGSGRSEETKALQALSESVLKLCEAVEQLAKDVDVSGVN